MLASSVSLSLSLLLSPVLAAASPVAAADGVALVEALKNKPVTVALKNGRSVDGTINGWEPAERTVEGFAAVVAEKKLDQ